MASLVEHFMMPPIVEWYYNGARDAIVATTTTKAYRGLRDGNRTGQARPGDILNRLGLCHNY